METGAPQIFNYIGYRNFLDDAYKFRKSKNPVFSHRYIGIKVSASSSGWFNNIIRGRINLTGTYIIRLAALFKLESDELDYFKLLVSYDQAGSVDERNFYLKKIKSFAGPKTVLIKKEEADFYSKWYISVIRELLFFYNFDNDFSTLAKMLDPPIRPKEAEYAMRILRALGFIVNDNSGHPRPRDPIVSKDKNQRIVYWSDHMKSKIKFGLRAIDRYSSLERDISEVYFPVSEAGLLRAREEIGSLRKKLLALSELDKNRDRVYQCNIQLFPLTQKQPPAKAGKNRKI